mgnify:CR=1 FL=1
MRKFRYIKYSPWLDNLTPGKVYDIIKYTEREEYSDRIEIINDKGEVKQCNLYNPINNLPLFEEATMEVRNEIIDGILK